MCVLGGGDAKSRVLFIYFFFSGGGGGCDQVKTLDILNSNFKLETILDQG